MDQAASHSYLNYKVILKQGNLIATGVRSFVYKPLLYALASYDTFYPNLVLYVPHYIIKYKVINL